MSELTNTHGRSANLRARLLITAGGGALLAAQCLVQPAFASDGDHPLVWVELGGQFAQLDHSQQAYLPPFTLVTPRLPFITQSPVAIEKLAPISWDGNAKISFEPMGSDWIFSAGIFYGRNAKNESLNLRTKQRDPSQSYNLLYNAYQNLSAKSTESHMILDFRAGKDVGMGKFGNDGNSVFGVGLRYAQFNSRNNVGIQYQPTNLAITYYHSVHRFYGSLDAARKFTGIGPSLSWDGSADLIGNPSEGNISFDWGANGAVLFGRQRATIHHQTSNLVVVYKFAQGVQHYPVYQHSGAPPRSKQVVVPNLGGFAGVSWRYPNAKISVGYRADFFFGAVDGGIDTAKKENVGFYGPFASVSIGIGG